MKEKNKIKTVINNTTTDKFNTIYTRAGDLTSLTTTSKDNLVDAINEVNAKPNGKTYTGGNITRNAATQEDEKIIVTDTVITADLYFFLSFLLLFCFIYVDKQYSATISKTFDQATFSNVSSTVNGFSTVPSPLKYFESISNGVGAVPTNVSLHIWKLSFFKAFDSKFIVDKSSNDTFQLVLPAPFKYEKGLSFPTAKNPCVSLLLIIVPVTHWISNNRSVSFVSGSFLLKLPFLLFNLNYLILI